MLLLLVGLIQFLNGNFVAWIESFFTTTGSDSTNSSAAKNTPASPSGWLAAAEAAFGQALTHSPLIP